MLTKLDLAVKGAIKQLGVLVGASTSCVYLNLVITCFQELMVLDIVDKFLQVVAMEGS